MLNLRSTKEIIMRTSLVSIGFLLIIHISLGQQKKIDKWVVLLDQTPNSEKRVHILDSLTEEQYKFSNNDNTQEYLKEQLKLATKFKLYDLKSNALTRLATQYLRKMQIDSSLYYIKEGFKDIEFVNTENKIDLFTTKARYYDRQRIQDSAIYFMEKIFKIDDFLNVGKKACLALSNTGAMYGNAGDNYTAMEYYIEAVDCAERKKAYSVQSFGLVYIGDVYMDMEEYEKAEEYLFEALNIAEKHLSPDYIGGVQRVIGLNKSRSGSYKEAIEWNEKSILNYKKVNNQIYIYDVTSNSGVAYHKNGQYKKALDTHLEALELAKEIKSQMAIDASKMNLAGTYIEIDKILIAEKLLLTVISDTSKYNQQMPTWLKSGILEGMFKILEKKGSYSEALKYHKLFISFNDSIEKKQNSKDVASLEIKYQTEKKEKENLALKAEKAEQETLLAQKTKRNWQLGGGLATAILGLGFFFMVNRKTNRQKKEIELQKNKVENLQKELHHRLKNNLAFIDLFISLAKGKFTDPAYQEKLNELQNRIKSMFEVHEQLFKKENVTSINTSEYIKKLANNVANAYANSNITITQSVETTHKLDSQTSFPLGIIINEFVTNSYKYAFNKNEKGTILIKLNENASNYTMTLSDNGKGLPRDFDINNIHTFGLDSIKLLIQEYKGTFSIDGSNGVTLHITLPKQAA